LIRPYLIARAPDDLYKDMGINYHYLLVEVDHPGWLQMVQMKSNALVAAARASAAVLYTEDLNHGQEILGVRISNPFV